MTTLIWEGDVYHDVHVISPAKFYKGSVIPIDCFFDFWNIAIATNQEILNKTKRKDSMSDQGRLKIIDGDKEEETNVVTLYSEHEQEDVKEWTQSRIDTLAETHREELETELKRRLEKT